MLKYIHWFLLVVIWVCLTPILIVSVIVLKVILGDMGLTQPYTWLVVVALIATILNIIVTCIIDNERRNN